MIEFLKRPERKASITSYEKRLEAGLAAEVCDSINSLLRKNFELEEQSHVMLSRDEYDSKSHVNLSVLTPNSGKRSLETRVSNLGLFEIRDNRGFWVTPKDDEDFLNHLEKRLDVSRVDSYECSKGFLIEFALSHLNFLSENKISFVREKLSEIGFNDPENLHKVCDGLKTSELGKFYVSKVDRKGNQNWVEIKDDRNLENELTNILGIKKENKKIDTEKIAEFVEKVAGQEEIILFLTGLIAPAISSALGGNPESIQIISSAGMFASLFVKSALDLENFANIRFGGKSKVSKVAHGLRKFLSMASFLGWGLAGGETAMSLAHVFDTKPMSHYQTSHIEKVQHNFERQQTSSTTTYIDNTKCHGDIYISGGQPKNIGLENSFKTDKEVESALNQYYKNRVNTDWQNSENGVHLSDVLSEQTMKFVSKNGFDMHSIDINKLSGYLTQSQLELLSDISKTTNYSTEYLQLLRSLN